jgi:hypothetical protein
MSLKPTPIGPIPELTTFVTRAALANHNICMRLCDEFGALVGARFSQKRGTTWKGYKALLSEIGGDGYPHLITCVETTLAVVQDVGCSEPIHGALIGKGMSPGEHLFDAGYVDAALLVRSRDAGIDLVGLTRPSHGWQTRVEGAYAADRFRIDWEAQRVTCPQGRDSSAWTPQVDRHGNGSLAVKSWPTDCGPCVVATRVSRFARLVPSGQDWSELTNCLPSCVRQVGRIRGPVESRWTRQPPSEARVPSHVGPRSATSR